MSSQSIISTHSTVTPNASQSQHSGHSQPYPHASISTSHLTPAHAAAAFPATLDLTSTPVAILTSISMVTLSAIPAHRCTPFLVLNAELMKL